MGTDKRTTRLRGAVFLHVFPASIISKALLDSATGTGSMSEILSTIPSNLILMRVSILIDLHPAQGDLSVLLAEQAAMAGQLGRRPFVEFSADWCPPCVALAESLDDPRMVEAFRGTYIIRLDYDEWKDHLRGTAFTVIGIPVFFELDSHGGPTGRSLTGAAWDEDIPENMAPPLEAFFRSGSTR